MPSKFFILCVISLLSQLAFSQQYTKIPVDTNYFWRQVSSCGNYRYQIRYYKDTIVGAKVYNKYSLFGATTSSASCSQAFIRNGFLRQDTIAKKVYILDPTFVERPLYNFSKTTGDTLLIYDITTNSNITYSVQMAFPGGLQLANSTNNEIVQQGIGAHEGGLYASRQYYVSPIHSERLICTGKINPFSVVSPPEVGFEGQCFLITGFNGNLLQNSTFKFYPNPVNDRLTIEMETNLINPCKIRVTNSLGQIVCELDDLRPKLIIDLGFLATGIYFLNVWNSFGQQGYKFIKE